MPGLKGVWQAFRRARSRLTGGIVVLGYHRVGCAFDPFGLNVSPQNFAAHLEIIANRTTPMRLPEAVDVARRARRPSGVVVTLDDGYADTFERALPAIERTGVPATVFVTTGYAGREFWWDELCRLFLGAGRLPSHLDLELPDGRRSWHVGGDRGPSGNGATRQSMLAAVADEVRVLPPPVRDDVMQRIRTWATEAAHVSLPVADAASGVPESRRGEDEWPRALTTEELRRLAANPGIDIGAHTVSHPVLSNLASDVQREEISRSRAHLQDVTGAEVVSFSYPHGAHTSRTRALVAEAGFRIACCSTPDALTSRSCPLQVPRLWVPDVDGDSFRAWLGRWLRW